MKKAIVLCLALFLTSCITVEDFGSYWDKATVDPGLAGRWKEDADAGNHQWVFALKNGAYEVTTYINGVTTGKDGITYPVRTLTAGPYKFLANGPENGTILRYDIVQDRAHVYVLDYAAAWDFIQKNYPNADNIYRDEPDDEDDADDDSSDPKKAAEVAENRPIKIKRFDDDVYQALSNIPNNGSYWHTDTELERVK